MKGQVSRRAALGGIAAAVVAPALIDSARAAPRSITFGKGESPLPRQDHTVTALPDGRLLVAGGYNLGPLASVQIYYPPGNFWFPAAPLLTARFQHAAAALPDGRVLVCGGVFTGPLASVEIYDPATDSWTPAAPLNVPRYQHGAASTGAGVVVSGGFNRGPLIAVEIFNEAGWSLI